MSVLNNLRYSAFIGLVSALIGAAAGIASTIFLISLNLATETRLAHPWLLFLLPVAGLLLGWVYHRYAGPAARGNQLVIEEVNHNRAELPWRMAPLVLMGTLITHLFGGSAGREGTAVQMGASLADGLRRVFGLSRDHRRLFIMAGISGGFASVFGTPAAGFVFGMEVQSMGRIRYEGVIPCLTAAIVGDLVGRALGAPHGHTPQIAPQTLDAVLVLKTVVASVGFGLMALLFIELTHLVKRTAARITWPPLRPLVGGLVIVILTLLLNTQDYLGLSLPLIQQSLGGEAVAPFAFLIKLAFTAITLGFGFLGGEVTPLFVIGATAGTSLAAVLGVDPVFLAAIGFVSVFAGASNTPLACALMGIELFGGGPALYLLIGCFVAYLVSGHRGIYSTQLLGEPKTAGITVKPEDTLASYAERQRPPR